MRPHAQEKKRKKKSLVQLEMILRKVVSILQ